MSVIDLFNEIVTLRNKIDQQMQLDIWPKLFRLLADPETATLNLSFDDFTDFLIKVAVTSNNRNLETNAALATGIVDNNATTSAIDTGGTQQRSILNLFGPTATTTSVDAYNRRRNRDVDETSLEMYRNTCRKVLQYYTLTNTNTTEFSVGDIVVTMIYLSKTPMFRPLYMLLKDIFVQDNECVPVLEPDQIHHIVHLLRNILELPTSNLDFNNVKLLKNTLNKVVNYPVTRLPRIIILPNMNLNKDKRCTFEDLLIARMDRISKLESEQYVNALDGSKIPYCDDDEFINELLKLTDNFSLPRMFYNATNSVFYTTMENYALTNCKFDIQDYNNIYKIMNDIKELKEKCGMTRNCNDITDSLNIYLGAATSKRKKY